ncbi:MAG: amphi-Trp domain-containing protein [Brevefilum sp.]|nr:amphi-Trp domain-containing protein [Brevefilum sp.]
MVKKAQLYKGKERKSRAEVSEFLAELSEKVANGQVILRQVHDDLVLELPHSMGMKVKVTQKEKRAKGTRHKLTLTLTWTEGDHEEPLALG